MTTLTNKNFAKVVESLTRKTVQDITSLDLSELLKQSRLSCVNSDRSNDLTQENLDQLCGYESDPLDREIRNRVMSDPEGWVIGQDPGTIEGAKLYGRIGQVLGSRGVDSVMQYHIIRDKVEQLQSDLKLNSLVGMKTLRLFEAFIEVSDFDEQMTQTEYDRLIMLRDCQAITNFVLMQMIGNTDYTIEENVSDTECSSVSIGEIFEVSLSAQQVNFHTQSTDWVKTEKGGWRGSTSKIRCSFGSPDEITLFFGDYNYDSCRSFVMTHKDPNRHPWLLKV